MKRTLIAALALSTLCVATSAAAADEEWVIVGGDGSAFGHDRTSLKPDASGVTNLRYAVYSASAMPTPAGMTGATLFGFLGDMAVNCKDRTYRPGRTTYFMAYGSERTVAATPGIKFEKAKPGAYHTYFLEVACGGRKSLDAYHARGRPSAVTLLKTVSAAQHVGNNAAKGWTFAVGDPARLVAIDTSSSLRRGSVVVQTELTWMRNPKPYNGQAWRYTQLTVEYDCAAAKRRGAGPFRVYREDDRPVHEEIVSDAAWEQIGPDPSSQSLLQIACKGAKLGGLPSGSRTAMLTRLKDIAAIE